MTAAEIAGLIESQFGAAITAKNLDGFDPCVTVDPAKLVDVCTFLRDDPRLKFELLNDITGVDYLEPDAKKAPKFGFDPHLEVLYHLSSFTFPGRRFTVKLSLPRWKNDVPNDLPEVPTVSNVWRAADWHEREVFDLVGITFIGHPDHRRILMADDWVGHPLRKDFEYPLEYHGIRCR